MREVGFYPGCSLEASAKDYAASVAGLAALLDIRLVEVPDWNCCGATAGHSLHHKASLNLAARNLALAGRGPQPLVVPCALCFNRLKSAQAELALDQSALIPEVAGLGGDYQAVRVRELNGFLCEPEVLGAIEARKVRDLAGLKVVCYYGCQGQRPPKVTGHPQHENPTAMDRLLQTLGAQVLDWPGKTDCCGASHAVPRPDIVHTLTGRLFNQALERGAQAIVTGCQMCQANLDLYQPQIAAQLGRPLGLPIFYFTELIALALGHPQAPGWLKRHMVDPRPLLRQAGMDL
jgi:heterodisulfide reductase subunit B